MMRLLCGRCNEFASVQNTHLPFRKLMWNPKSTKSLEIMRFDFPNYAIKYHPIVRDYAIGFSKLRNKMRPTTRLSGIMPLDFQNYAIRCALPPDCPGLCHWNSQIMQYETFDYTKLCDFWKFKHICHF